MSSSVADRVTHRLPRPIVCAVCGSPHVRLQKRNYMGLKVYADWDLIWHCGDCNAMVGCHRGTDIPLGHLADAETRWARSETHRVFDRLWGRGKMTRAEAYLWLAKTLGTTTEEAHIGRLTKEQCQYVQQAAENCYRTTKHNWHWTQKQRKRRRK